MEVSRIYFKVPGRNALVLTMLCAGLFAHTVFLVNQFSTANSGGPQLLANWFQWSVLGAWGLALAYLVLVLRNSQTAVGLFLIPLILGLIGLGQLLRESVPFAEETTINVWRIIHGVSLLIGTMFICFGVAFGIMYLIQSFRLKSKRSIWRNLKLPTLEFLQSMNRLSLFATVIGLAIGLLSGVVLNVIREGQLEWLSSDILVTCGLFLWALIAAVLEISSRGSLGGRRSAYLVIANFVILIVVLGIVLLTSHGQSGNPPQARASSYSQLSLSGSPKLHRLCREVYS